MTTLKLDTLSDRIKAHKNALVHIVKPPVCTERAQHYTEMYQQHLDKPIPVRRALALAHHLRSEEHTSELQSRFDLVCRLLLEKKKKHSKYNSNNEHTLSSKLVSLI